MGNGGLHRQTPRVEGNYSVKWGDGDGLLVALGGGGGGQLYLLCWWGNGGKSAQQVPLQECLAS